MEWDDIINLNETSQENNQKFENLNISEKKINYLNCLILLIIALFILGLGFYYYLYFNNEFSLLQILQELRQLLDENTFQQICSLIVEILKHPDKREEGLELLYLIKVSMHPKHLLNGDNQEFIKIMTKLIKILITLFQE